VTTDQDAKYDYIVHDWLEQEGKAWMEDSARLHGAPCALIAPEDVLNRGDLAVGRTIKSLIRDGNRVVIGRKKPEATGE
jgi:hypothetical protein